MSTPDLAMVHSNLSGRANLSLGDPHDGSGHRSLILKIAPKKRASPYRQIPRWNFKKADWGQFCSISSNTITENLIDDNPDKSTDRFVNAVLLAAKRAVPRGQVKRYKPFWNAKLTELKANRDKARRKAESTNLQCDSIDLRKKQAQLKRAIITEKRETYRHFVASLDFRRDGIKAHNFISSLNNEKKTHKWEPVQANGKTLTNPKEIAATLCKHFSAVSQLTLNRNERKAVKHGIPTCATDTQHHLFNDPFTLAELELAIHSHKKGKAAGPDKIFPEFLKNLGENARKTLLKLANLTWEKHVPHSWKKAEITAILKKGKPANSLTSFRPISLTSIICKTVEKMIDRRLRHYLEDAGAISDCQAGFRQHRSTVDQIVKLTQAVKDGFHRKQSTLAVFIDLKAAYDKVWRSLLLRKLSQLHISGNMRKWIKNFLAQRFIRTKFQNAVSNFRQVRQGLPQGAVLSCLLFNVMINDLQQAIERTPGVQCLLYADDVVIWSTSSSVDSLEETMNNVLTNIATWCRNNKMMLNAEKTVFELFTLSTKPHPIQLTYDRTELARTYDAKYLGVYFDYKLSWAQQIQTAADKAQKRNNLLKRLTATKWGATQEVLATAYKTYVRPVMEYASEVTALSSEANLRKLEVVQNNALRIITGAAISAPITAMQLQSGVDPLRERREKLTLKFWERAKRIDHRHWENYRPAPSRLKTQTTPLTHAEKIREKYHIQHGQAAKLSTFHKIFSFLPAGKLTLINHTTPKALSNTHDLKSAALQTIHELYKRDTWVHVYTCLLYTSRCV